MKLRIVALAAVLAVAGLAAPRPAGVPQLGRAAAVSCANGYVTFYSGLNATGSHSNLFCLDLGTAWDLGANPAITYTNGNAMNNSIESFKWQESASGHAALTFWMNPGLVPGQETQYYNAPAPPHGDVVFNLPAPYRNQFSGIRSGICSTFQSPYCKYY